MASRSTKPLSSGKSVRPGGSSNESKRAPAWLLLILVLPLEFCAPRPLALPTGPGVPLADFQSIFERAAGRCRGIRTLTAELGLSGRAGDRKIRGRALIGLASPASLRLEAIAPFGPPVFVLAAERGVGTLLLPRDDRVLTGAPPAAILEAVAGIALAPEDLRGILAGCVVADPSPIQARAFGDDWLAVDLDGGATAYLRRPGGVWRIVAGVRAPLVVEYSEFQRDEPGVVRIRTSAGPGRGPIAADLTVRLAQVELNVALDPAAFSIVVPPDAAPLTLDELREAGPLGGRPAAENPGTQRRRLLPSAAPAAAVGVGPRER